MSTAVRIANASGYRAARARQVRGGAVDSVTLELDVPEPVVAAAPSGGEV